MFLKVHPHKGIHRLSVRGKLTPIYVGPFKVIERLGAVAYKLELPPQMSYIHNVFHVSQLNKSSPSAQQVMIWDDLPLQNDRSYVE